MNNRQQETLKSQLNDEQQTLNKLKVIYKKSLGDINDKIAALKGRTDTENLQSIIYQIEYQQALKQQINGILDTMNAEQFTTISEYLTKSYDEGYFAVMYDLTGQGVPVIIPINQDQVVRAIQHETKLSKSLYKTLGEDVNILKKRIQNNIARGIAQGSSYADIARNIASGMIGDYSNMKGGAIGKAYTIARTEGHRISSKAAFDAQKAAKATGADIVKQWDATLDNRTRPHHQRLDGQIREIEDPFEIEGNQALYPGGFGIASEDIHCRCYCLQRARWGLDDEELKVLQDRAAYFGLDKTKDFDDFKAKYLKAAVNVAVAALTIDACSDFQSMKKYMKNTYNIEVDASVGTLHYASVQEATKGIEKVLIEFPQAQKILTDINLNNRGAMAASYSGQISFNPDYYDDPAHLINMIMGDTTGFHPKNTGVLETGSHEMGHLLERAMIEKSVASGKCSSGILAWVDCTEAKAIISEACKAAKKTPEGRNIDGKLFRNAELIDQVSGYAKYDRSECVAECVADYVANGENAAILSKEVWKILKRELG